MRELTAKHKRYGSPRIHVLLKREGLAINHKRTERIYREEGLSLRRRTKKRRILPARIQMPQASKPGEVWSMDFMSDTCASRRRLKILTIVDDFSKVSPGIMADTSIPSRKVIAYLDQIALLHGYPDRIRVDNGPEFTSAVFHQWAEEQHIIIEHTRPGKPSDNAFIESFNGKVRDECLNEHWFINVSDAQEKIGAWREAYNQERPHSSLNNLSPYEFIKEHYMNQGLNLNMAHITG
jgi:putative transposase